MSEPTGPKRILVLDDDADFRALLRSHLGRLFDGAEIQEYDPVARGVPAQDFDWSRYDVLILDYYLCIHNVTGLDILQANRKNRFFPAAIMLTGAGSEEIAVRAVKAGVYDYLRKEKLDKEQLKKSILNAYAEHKEEQQRLSELTNQSQAFNKALFYQKLESGEDADARDRVLLLIELDDASTIGERVGAILRDNIVRHLAHRCFEVFQVGECHPHVTRLGDTAVAFLIDKPASAKTLEFNMDGLCAHLKKRPYKFDDKKLRFTVSIGVVEVPRTGRSAERLIGYARHAADIASRVRDRNSFHIFQPEVDGISEPPVLETAPTETAEAAGPAPASAAASPGTVLEAPAVPPPPATTKAPPATPAKAPAAAKPAAAKPPAAARSETRAAPPAAAAAPTAPVAPAAAAKPTPRTVKPAPAGAAPGPAPGISAKSAPPPRPAPAAAKAASDESGLDESSLGEEARKIYRAFTEKRIVQTFQPVMPLFNEEGVEAAEMYRVHLQFIDRDGSVKTGDYINTGADTPDLQKFIDRWLLRETIGRVVNHPDSDCGIVQLAAQAAWRLRPAAPGQVHRAGDGSRRIREPAEEGQRPHRLPGQVAGIPLRARPAAPARRGAAGAGRARYRPAAAGLRDDGQSQIHVRGSGDDGLAVRRTRGQGHTAHHRRYPGRHDAHERDFRRGPLRDGKLHRRTDATY
jgi:CheY-like chemotaxis protein